MEWIQKICDLCNKICDSCNANDPEFWIKWSNAGGKCDEYIKEIVPNYSLIGTLLLGFSLSISLSPPEIKHISVFITIMNISTISSMALILISIFMHSQFMCCYDIKFNDDNTAENNATINFCKCYGGLLLKALTLLLMIDTLTLTTAILIFFYDTYNKLVFFINLGLMIFSSFTIIITCFRLQSWNYSDNYNVLIEKILD